MNKPSNYDSVSVGGFTPVQLGGHHLIIKQVKETQSKAGKPMIVVCFDMAKNDCQPLYMSAAFADDDRPDKKWPRSGTQYIVTENADGTCSRSFKSFITSVEHSNNGFETKWGADFEKQFAGKRIGGVFGEVENEYNGKRTMRHELRWFCDDNKAEGQNVPDAKLLPAASSRPSADSFINVTSSDEEIPF